MIRSAIANLPIPVLLLILPVLSTLAGGLFAVRFRRFLPVLLALGAGLLLGAALLDLLPEALDLGRPVGMPASSVLGLTLLFFLASVALEGLLDHHASDSEPHARRRLGGRIGGAMMIFHSFRDGLAIGAAFSASHAGGYAVGLGIVAHDLGDGMNTVLLTTRGAPPRLSDFVFLLADALAPFAGALVSLWWLVSAPHAVVLLSLTAGFFLQMATSDLLPRVRNVMRESSGHRLLLFAAVAAGACMIYLANLLLRLA